MADDTQNQDKPDSQKPEKANAEKPDFEPPEGFGPDFVNKAVGESTKKR